MNNQKIKRPAGFLFWFKANCWYFPLLGLVIYSVLPNSFHITWSALFLRCTRFSPTSLARVRVIMTIVRAIIGQLGPTPGEICCQTLDTALNINTWLWLRYSLGIMKPKQIVKSIISPLNFHWSTYTKTITNLSTTGNKNKNKNISRSLNLKYWIPQIAVIYSTPIPYIQWWWLLQENPLY